ncbi:MAG: hypothetical protein O3C52_06370 [Proteobacteria bacterium]|nr:hypothetical protein [Pseudomonadota bacterium]MDA1032978.1 hypothetical protein [Pseudomonadota bacterium]
MLNEIDYQVTAMMDGFARYIPVIIVAIIILVLNGLLAGFVVKVADRITGEAYARPSLRNLLWPRGH